MSSRTHPVTITFAGHNLHPPVFVAGSFTQPKWRPEAMESVLPEERQRDYGLHHVYSKDFDIPEGRYHYKFRLGHGDWWVCDETIETEPDAHGNFNNILIVGTEGGTTNFEPGKSTTSKKPSGPVTAIDRVHEDVFKSDEDYEDTPLMPHESPSLGGLEVDPGPRARRTSLGFRVSRVNTFIPPEPTKEDLKDPEVEKFPGSKSAILNRMHTLRREIPIDDSSHLDNPTNGIDPMSYQLSRSLDHLTVNKQDIPSIEWIKIKNTSEPTSPGPNLLDGVVEEEVITAPLTPSSVLRKSTPRHGSYGTLRPLTNHGSDGSNDLGSKCVTSKNKANKSKYVSFATEIDRTKPNNASADYPCDSNHREQGHKATASNDRDGKKPETEGRAWIDKVAAGAAIATVGVLLVGGWAFVTVKERG